MSVANFIPEIMAKKILLGLQAKMVGANFINRNYDGEINSVGDTVNIVSPGSITVSDHDKDVDIVWQNLTSSQKKLMIDIEEYFSFVVPDIDAFQAKPDLQKIYTEVAIEALSQAADKKIFGKYVDAHTDNVVATIVLTKDNIYDHFVDMRTLFVKKNVPTLNLSAAVGADEYAILLKSDEFIRATQSGDSVVRTGLVGQIAGFDVYETNNLAEDVEADLSSGDAVNRYLMFTNKAYGITMAEQINKVEVTPIEKRFAKGVKGLHTYGLKTVRTEALGVIRSQLKKIA